MNQDDDRLVKQLYYSMYKTMLNDVSESNEDNILTSEDDKLFRKHTTDQITKRDDEYTELLIHFVQITKIRNQLKEFFKWSFYAVIILSMILLIAIVYVLFEKIISEADMKQILESMPILITSLVGFVSTIIAIPVTITKYLFSTEEDKYITDIISHTQEHDTTGRQWSSDSKKEKS